REALEPAEQLNYDLFARDYEERLAAYPFHPEAYRISASEGVQVLKEVAELMPFSTVADYEVWLRRLAALPVFLEQNAALLGESARARRTQPRLLMERGLPPLTMQLSAGPAKN